MHRFPLLSSSSILSTIGAVVILGAALQSSFADDMISAQESNAAKNLARMNCGAKIDYIMPDGRFAAVPNASEKNLGASALIMDDNTLSCPLQQGETTFIVTLPRTSLFDRFTFVNENAMAEGDMKISVSNYRLPARSPKWTDVNGRTTFTHKRLFNLSMVGIEARYLKLSFHVEKAGRIAALGLYGGESLQRFADRQGRIVRVSNTMATRRLEDMLNFNFANLYAKGRVVFVSSGSLEAAQRMVDDDAITSFQFAPSDPHPTAIVELADTERLHRVSTLYKMQSGRLEIFLLKELSATPGDSKGLEPVASITDVTADGKAAADFSPQGARYVVFRWTPSEAQGDRAFEVAEISAFGNVPLSMLNTNSLPDVYASNGDSDKKISFPVEPPLLVEVSQ